MKLLKYLPIFIWFSCAQTDVAKPTTRSKWFDLKQFVTHANALLPQNAPFEKTLVVNGSSETKKVTIEDWTTELTVFGQSDINRPAWRDKYQVDTLHLEVTTDTAVAHRIQHVAKDKSLRTKFLSIAMNRKMEPLAIEILNEQSHFFSHSQQHLTWDLRAGYSITAQQKMLLRSATETVLRGRFLK